MNQFQRQSCIHILDLLEENPIYKMFEDPPSMSRKNEKPVYFQFIRNKLKQSKYNSVREFVLDVRTIFRNAQETKNDDIFYKTGAKLLSEKFEGYLCKGYLTNNHQDDDLFKISQYFDEMSKAFHPQDKLIKKQKINMEPAATIFNEDIPKNVSVSQINTGFKVLKNLPSLLTASFHMESMQNNSISFGHYLCINASLLKDDVKNSLYQFLLQKLKEEAKTDHVSYM